MLEINNLRAGYGKMEILHKVNLQVRKGEIVAIIGPNGSGKSTTLKSIFGLCDIYSGKIIVNGEDLTQFKTHEKIYRKIAYVPQGRQLFNKMTVHENLIMGAFSLKNKENIEFKLGEAYKLFPFLKNKKNRKADTLSGGQQQMLALARAMIIDPDIILLDEPSLGLSPIVIKQIFQKIKEMNSKNISIIIVEQNVNHALDIADNIYLFDDGNIKMSGKKDIFDIRSLKDIYFK